MKTRQSWKGYSAVVFALTTLIFAASSDIFAQSKTSAGNGAANGSTDSSSQSSNKNSTQPASAQQSSPSSNRIEASIISYEASARAAAHIAAQIKGKKVLIYDSQTFSTLQAYDGYAATISMLESAFQAGAENKALPFLPDAQSIVSTLAMVRSSTEYSAQTVDLNADAIVAQVISELPESSVIFPKFLLAEQPDVDITITVQSKDCASIKLNVPSQLACLYRVRQGSHNNPAYTDVDKLFQSFIATVIGTSSTAKTPKDASAPAGATPVTGDTSSQNQSSNGAILPTIIQGHRLKEQLSQLDSSKTGCCRLLVLEGTAAGGSSRLLHNFWVEVFWRTPTPAFNGGATLTYFLIDPSNSAVLKAEVVSYIYKYSKFKGMTKAPNPFQSWSK